MEQSYLFESVIHQYVKLSQKLENSDKLTHKMFKQYTIQTSVYKIIHKEHLMHMVYASMLNQRRQILQQS